MPLKINGATSGGITLDVPAAAGTNTLTLPARTGNIITSADSGTVTGTMLAAGTVTQSNLASNIAGNGPAFSAYATSAQSIATGTYVKLQFSGEDFDTANCFDSTTNYRFTPNVAGYYQINGTVWMASSAGVLGCQVYKNGSVWRFASQIVGTANVAIANASTIVYLNGSTDYVELWCWHNNGTTTNTYYLSATASPWFNGFLVRAA